MTACCCPTARSAGRTSPVQLLGVVDEGVQPLQLSQVGRAASSLG
jgi:hypothetical protein